MAIRKAVALKKKKLWFRLLAPDIFKNVELGEIPSFEGKSLIGRVVELNYSLLTEAAKDPAKKFVAKIVKVNDDKAITEPMKLLYSESFIQRTSKRYSARVLVVDKIKSKDHTLTYKIYLLGRKKIVGETHSNLIKKTKDFMAKHIKEINFDRLFEPNYLESLCKEIKKEVKSIYPVDRAIFWKVLRG